MADTLSDLIIEAKRNKYSLIPNVSENDVLSVWDAVSGFIEEYMLQQKGVTVLGLGTFTFSQKKIDIGSNKFIIIQRPMFVLSERFAQIHSLQHNKQHSPGQIPTVPLNFTVLSNMTPFDRDTVELCVKEVLQAMGRSLAARKNIQFDFGNIGRLVVLDRKAKMRFFRDFIASLDTSGEMEYAFRPDTAQSVLSIMSNPCTPRPSTTNTLTLPHIVQPSGSNMLTLDCAITPPRSAGSITTTPPGANGRGFHTPSKMPSIVEDAEQEEEEEEPFGNDISSGDIKWSPELQDERPLPHSLVPKPVGLFVSTPTNGMLWEGHSQHGRFSAPPSRLRRSVSTPAEGKRRMTAGSAPATPQSTVRPSTCSHMGQELCYLCHQRELHNIPVDVSQERREKEKAEDKLLQEYQQQKDLLSLAREHATKSRNRQFNQEIASFNFEMAKNKIPRKSSEFHPSYVFQQRAITPAKYLKQQAYCGQLDEQVGHKQAQLREASEREERMEKEERLQLAKELADYQEAYAKEKAANVAQYQKALAEQVAIKHEISSIWGKLSLTPSSTSASHATSHASTTPLSPQDSGSLRPLSIPKPTVILPFSNTKKDGNMKVCMKATFQRPTPEVTDSTQQQPVFGIHDASEEKKREEKERIQAYFLDQLKMVSEKQCRMREKARREQQEGEEMLTKTRQSLISELKAEKKRRFNVRRSLEDSWHWSIQEKQHRLAEELQEARDPSLLLHQQCEKYARCKQCQRSRTNKGQSNILHESRYISGARMMV